MKLITWNCNMAFRKKWKFISKENADILVIQECEKPEKFPVEKLLPECTSSIWVGENPNKGVGIFAFNGCTIDLIDSYNPNFKYIIPIQVKGKLEATLFAIWAMPDKINSNSYVGQIWNAINYYKTLFNNYTILAGDFNSNQIWDKSRPKGNHTSVVEFLKERDIISLYHFRKKETHGKEKEPTLYLLKKESKPYHMDYCFLSKSLIQKKTSIKISTYDDCIQYSDHMTVIIDNINED